MKPTQKQIDLLYKLGIIVPKTRGEASTLIGDALARNDPRAEEKEDFDFPVFEDDPQDNWEDP